jgi:hypothetical protein
MSHRWQRQLIKGNILFRNCDIDWIPSPSLLQTSTASVDDGGKQKPSKEHIYKEPTSPSAADFQYDVEIIVDDDADEDEDEDEMLLRNVTAKMLL